VRTYDRATLDRARAAWADGDFDERWAELRRISWERGFPMPPEGTRWDNPEEDGGNSQRAIVWRAFDNRPRRTVEIVSRSRSWSDVVARIMAAEEWLREDADHRQTDSDEERADRPSHREAAMTLANVLERIATSRGIEPSAQPEEARP
jgi:hypothetical protein